MMKLLRRLSVIVWCISLVACSPTQSSTCEVSEPCVECQVCPSCDDVSPSLFDEGLVLPQIYIQGKLFWSNKDLSDLDTNIIQPIVAYYEDQGHTVVSISVSSDDLASGSINTIIVEVITSDNDGNQDPLYMGVLIEKEAGSFPVWEQEDMGP
jgi:hypothetical protein